jgi:O-antigen/teichoic acid export membrane protein
MSIVVADPRIMSENERTPSETVRGDFVAQAPDAEPEPAVDAKWMRPDRFSDSVAIMLTLTAVQRFVGFGRSVVICVLLGAYEVGQWDMAFGFLTLAAPIAVLSLPAAFGRYVEYYRQRGQLRTFLRRVATATVLMAVVATFAIAFGAERFSQWLYDTGEHAALMRVIAATLLANILYNIVAELFTALRMQRIASGMEFVQSLTFAAVGVALAAWWSSRAVSVVAAYGVGCLAALALSSVWLWHMWREMPATVQPPSQRVFWPKVISFVAWVWVSNWLVNSFMFVDRYMVVHFSRMSNEAATALVGQYHSSRLVPLLLVSVTTTLSAIMIPFLSRDWEMGRRDRLAARLNLVTKMTAIALTATAALVLAGAPLLFGVVLRGRFEVGLEMLPWTLMYFAWFGVMSVARVYLWCAEKVWLVSIAYLGGLIMNIGLNLVLVPPLGLWGAVLGTCGANFVVLALVFWISASSGLRLDRATWLVSLLPLALAFGLWGAVAATATAIVLALATDWLITEDDRREMISVAQRYLDKFLRREAQSTVAPSTAVSSVD